MSDAPYLWLGRPGQETLQRGIARELAEQSAEASHEAVMAPPCPACGRPVRDAEWETHKREAHGINEMCRPHGKAESREALFVHVHAAKLEEKIAIWKSRHPGIGLTFVASGFDQDRKLYWARYFVLDGRGKRAR